MSLKATLARSFAKWTARSERRKAIAGLARQEACFNALIAKGAHTAFGRDHGVHEGMSVEAFQAAVPVRDYEGLKAYVDRAVAGEHDVLWPGQPLYFCKTSGTTSGAKFIPLTSDSMPNHLNSARNALLQFIANSGRADFLGRKDDFLARLSSADQDFRRNPHGEIERNCRAPCARLSASEPDAFLHCQLH